MKKLTDIFDAELLIKCLFLWIFVYSIFVALVEISFFYLLFPIIIYTSILYFTLTPPNENLVKNVLGENPRVELRDTVDLNLTSNSELNRSFSIAHNAAVLDFNDNNAEAVKMCSQYGCQTVYLDVNVTKDNRMLIHRSSKLNSEHDECNVTKFIKEHSKKPNLSTLEEILPTLENLNVRIIFNIINPSYYKISNETVNALLKIYEKKSFCYERAIISSTNPLLLYKIRKNDPSIVVAMKWTGTLEQPTTSISWLKKLHYCNSVKYFILEYVNSCSWWLLNQFLYRIIGISAVILPKEIITPKIIEDWERRNIRCIVGIVNLSTEKSYYANALGVAFLTDTLLNNPS